MKSKQIVLTLGYIAIFCVALYFVFGLLQISGRGLTSMVGGPMIEGFKPAEFDKSSDTLEKQINKMKQEKGTKDILNFDNISEFNEYKDKILEYTKIQRELAKANLHKTVINSLNKGSKPVDFNDSTYSPLVDKYVRLDKLVKVIEEDADYDV